MKRFGTRVLTAVIAGSLIVMPVSAAPTTVDELKKSKESAQGEVSSLKAQLTKIIGKIDKLERDLIKTSKEIDTVTVELGDAKEQEKQQYEDMKLRIKYMYEEGNAGFLSALIRAESYADLVSKAEYVQKVHDYDRKMLDEYVETKNEVAELKDNLEEGQAEMQALSDEMVVQKENLETTLTQMRSQIEDFDSQLVQAKEAAAEELRRIEAEQRAAEEAEAAARQQQEAEEAAAAAAEQQAQEDSQQKEDDASKDDQASSKPSDTSDDKKDEGQKEESKPKPSKPSENDTDQEGGKDDAKDDQDDDGDKQDDKTDNVPAAKPGNAALGQQIADMGCNYIGNKYVYGGTSLTNGIDCSGFVQQIHKKFGISTPRTSGAIRSGGKSVSYADRMPGDVICYSGHVGIYIGNNKIVHASNSAPYPRGGIKITSPANYRTVLAVRRYW